MKKQVGVISGIVLSIIMVIFVLLNMNETAINFGFATVKLPLILVLLITMLLGALIMFSFSSVHTFKTGRKSKQAQKEIDNLKQENNNLQTKFKNLEVSGETQHLDKEQEIANNNKKDNEPK